LACSALKFEFATDSPLEGDDFEPSVPVAREPVYIAEGELRGDPRAAKKIWRGTDGSNPSPSRRESANHRFRITVLAVAIYLVTRLRGREITGEESSERAALSIVAALADAFMLGAPFVNRAAAVDMDNIEVVVD
jgi:hypothetical protein